MTKLRKRILLALVLVVACIAGWFVVLKSTSPLNAYAATDAVGYATTEQTGLGLGINVVTAKQVNDFTTGHSVLDPAKISSMSSSRVTLNENVSYTSSSTDIEELAEEFNLKFGIGAEAGTFMASLKANLNLAGGYSYQNYSYKHFSVLEHKISRYRQYLNNYLNASTYSNYYSSEYLSDLNALKTNKNYTAFFEKYGTHIVGSAIYGGRLNATYSLVSNKFIMNSDVEGDIEGSITFGKAINTTKLISSLNSKWGTSYSSSDLKSGFYVSAVGGNAFASGVISSFESGYTSWTNSFNSSTANSVIVDYSADGLVPLWNILPSGYTTLATEMQNAYKQYYKDNANTVVNEFKTANYKDFNGGSGSEKDPFLIATEQHLKNIESVSMNANYKLTKAITLSTANWRPIGGFYKEKMFNGTLDGNMYYIYNLSRTADIAEVNGRFYFGLFGCIGPQGVVKELYFDRVNIQMTGPEVNNANARVFVGVLAGSIYGTADIVSVFGGTCSYDICTNGISYVGAIAGVAYKAYITRCGNQASITSGRYSSAAGGIVGYSTGATITRCVNNGNIQAKCTGWGGAASAGGIAGEIYNATNDPSLVTLIEECPNLKSPSSDYYGWGMGHALRTGDPFAYSSSEKLE